MKTKIFIALFFPCFLFMNVGNSSNTSADFEEFTTQGAYYSTTLSSLNSLYKKELFTIMATSGNCEFEGQKLYGKMKFVSSFPDFTIKYVESFPDLKVKFVNSFPDDCGEWQEVSSFPDFKVKIVTSFPDLKVKKVTSWPGMN